MSFHQTTLTALQSAPLQQQPEFGAALSHLGRSPVRLLLPDQQREIQIMVRRFGPLVLGVVSRADLARKHLPLVRKATGCRALIVNAETPGKHPGLRLRSAASIAELALIGSAADMRAQMAQKWRNRLNRAMNQGLRIRHVALPPDPGHWLLRIENAQQQVKRYRGYPPEFAAAYAAANRGKARLFEAWHCGELAAAMLFLSHGNGATYHAGWSGPEGRSTGAHHRLLWEAMVQLPRHGICSIDLGTVDTEAAPGLARFKLGSGALCRELGGSYLLWL